MPRPAASELVIAHPDGRVEVGDASMRFPNGSVVMPDGRTLIVAETYGEGLTGFTIADDGTLGEKRTWATVAGTYPDGICLDAEGCVWFADARGAKSPSPALAHPDRDPRVPTSASAPASWA